MPFRQLTVSGLPALALSNAEVECVVVPSLGGKITNLRRRKGREWLWRHPEREFSFAPPDGSFPDVGGWDECFPTVAASPMPGAAPSEPPLPDHGELRSLEWSHEVLETPAGTVLTSRAEGKLLPYEFQRDVIVPLEGADVRLEYRLIHRGTALYPWIWSAHPVFSAPVGMTVTLPTVNEVRVDHAAERPDLPTNATVPWPLDGQSHSWTVPDVRGWSAKLFADIGASGTAILTDPRTNEQLHIGFDPSLVPQVGIWIDATGEFARIGIEPCIGAPDRLDRAVTEWGMAATLSPNEVRRWAITLRLPEAD